MIINEIKQRLKEIPIDKALSKNNYTTKRIRISRSEAEELANELSCYISDIDDGILVSWVKDEHVVITVEKSGSSN